jgi:hypothetical protein
MKTQHIKPLFSKFLAKTVAICLLTTASYAAVITPVAFTPSNPIGGGPIGWTFAGNKFVGSILDNGTGQNLLYSTPHAAVRAQILNRLAPFSNWSNFGTASVAG